MDLTQLFTRLKTLGGALTTAQRFSLAGAFVAVVAIVGGSAFWLQQGDYTLLFADMDAEAAGEVVTRLKSEKVPYVLDAGGRAIRVPASKVDELRLEFASQGLPSSGRIGFEIFDRTAFGATEFLEQVNYRRALEGEIARTIGTLSEVSGARVHIAMARQSLFASREQPAKASVVLKLRGSRALAPATVQGITNLVASSVEGLRPESVVIMDSFGRPLARPQAGEEEPLGGVQMERQQRVERDLTSKVIALLEPVVGAAGVRVNVSARLDPESEEATEERWDPEETVIRSRQFNGDAAGLAASAAEGLAGTRANLPPPVAPGQTTPAPPPAAATATPRVPGRVSETTNYEISRTTKHTVRPRGDLARLSVAVIVDNESVATKNADGSLSHTSKPRTPEQLQKITALVGAAVGLDTERGDHLTVENVPFEETPVETPVPLSMWQRYAPPAADGLRMVGPILLGVLALLFFVRPLVRRVTSPTTVATIPATAGGQLPRSIADIEAQIDASIPNPSAEKLKLPVLTRRLGALTTSEPEHAARLLRMWIAEDQK